VLLWSFMIERDKSCRSGCLGYREWKGIARCPVGK
jgi:hypothetical protein